MDNNEFIELLDKIREGRKPAVFDPLTQPQLDSIKKTLDAKKQDIDEYYDYLKESRLKFKPKPLSTFKRLFTRRVTCITKARCCHSV